MSLGGQGKHVVLMMTVCQRLPMHKRDFLWGKRLGKPAMVENNLMNHFDFINNNNMTIQYPDIFQIKNCRLFAT